MSKVDKSKPLPEIFEALMAAAVEDHKPALPAPRNTEQDKQDCTLPPSNTTSDNTGVRTMAEDLPAFLKNKHGLNKEADQDIPFDPPYTTAANENSGGTTDTNGGSTGTTIETPGSDGLDSIYLHKLGEFIVPLKLLMPILAMFPADKAYRVSQIANQHGEIDVSSPESKMRHVVIYDTHESLHKYERAT